MYILVETFGGPESAVIVTDTDGENMVFNTAEEAQAYADENLQCGIVVPS